MKILVALILAVIAFGILTQVPAAPDSVVLTVTGIAAGLGIVIG